MGIGLGGSTTSHPTPKFKIQVDGNVLPGYCQSIEEPGTFRLSAHSISGRDGGPITNSGAENKTVTLGMRVLSRLDNVDGLQHLNDCLDQYREALEIAARADNAVLHIGDTDRYLEDANLASWSAPLEAPDHKAVDYTLTFQTQPWYVSTTTFTATRNTVSNARITGTPSGSISYIAARYNTGLLSNVAGEKVSFPSDDNLGVSRGSLMLWAKPQFASTSATNRTYIRVGDADNWWELGWNGTSKRFELAGNGTAGAETYATAPSVTFSSGNNIFLCAGWDNTGTDLHAGLQSGALVSGSTATPLFDNIPSPTHFYVGGSTTVHSNSVISNVVTFDSRITTDQATHVFEDTAPYDPLDTNLPTTMLLDAPLSGTVIAASSSNNLYVDIPNSRRTYPIIRLFGGLGIQLGVSGSAKLVDYTAAASPEVTVDCGLLTAVDADGNNVIANIADVDFGLSFTGDQRAALETRSVSGSLFYVEMDITPYYER